MFIPFGGGMPLRHRAFDSSQHLRRFLVEKTPHSTFYSTAYWRHPDEYKMDEKEWLGADLIFDLDGDHLPGIDDLDFISMLEHIQVQAHKLWNDFLNPEFGFEEKYLQVTFSGHRGYHLHYRDPKLAHLDSEARRELVAHIRGEGIDVAFALERWGDHNIGGWTERLRNGMNLTLERLDLVREGDAGEANPIIEEMVLAMKRSASLRGKHTKRGPTVVKKIADLVAHESRRQRLRDGNWNALGGRGGAANFHRDALIDILRGDSAIILGGAGETDEVVTVDTRRVIRWPTSLHGKCGLRVTELPLERLDIDASNTFDPLSESLALSMDEKMTVRVEVEAARTRVGEKEYELFQGDILELPEAAAAFIVLKGWGAVISS
jgi:DNA primase small subunit